MRDHLIELWLLIVVQQLPDPGDGGFAQAVNLFHLLFPRHGAVLHQGHGLLVLVYQNVFGFRLLVGSEVQLIGKYFDLLVNV